ncbi:MAG: BatA and WFA domain-containing protein [Melioribacteraceae bacterium]
MVFLNPSILLGLLAASIPILIHILNFRKLKKVEFSTLSFLKELQKSKIKKIKIKQWLLLLIRTLIIIFLVFSFSRPTLESASLLSTNSLAKSTNVFILDNSFSMLALNKEGSNYNRSKSIIKKIISEMQNEDEFHLITAGNSEQLTSNKETALKILEQNKVSNKTFDLSKSLSLAKDILAKSQNINKQIFLFSDFQKNILGEVDDSVNASLKNEAKLYVFPISANKKTNTSISTLKLESTIVELNKPLEFTALVHNYSDFTQKNLITSLFINNVRLAQQSITINKNEERKVSFETTLNKTGLMKAHVQIEDDDIIIDNKSFTSFYVTNRIKVLLLYDNLTETKFINAALSTLSTSSRIDVTKKNNKYFSSTNVNQFDLVILVGGNNLNDIQKLRRSISEGTKLIYFPSDNTSLTKLESLHNYLGLPKAKEIIKTDVSKNDFAQFDFIDFQHPIFSHLFSNDKKNKIDSPNFYKYIKFSKTNSSKPIIKLSDNSVFLGEYKINKGKIVFFSFAVNLGWSNFPIKSLFAPLINRLVIYLTSGNKKSRTYLVDEKIPIQLNNFISNKMKIKLPDGEEFINLENRKSKILGFNNTSIPGTYEFFNKNKMITFASVNVNPKESDLTNIDSKKIEEYFSKKFEENYVMLDSDENYISKIKQARFGSELWKLFLGVAFMLALIEMFLSRSTKKDLVAI